MRIMITLNYLLILFGFICFYMIISNPILRSSEIMSQLGSKLILIDILGIIIALGFAQGLSAMKAYILFLDDERKIMEIKLHKDKQ